MRYICRKDNPLVVKSFGYVQEGGLGEFNPDIYEEIEGPLPENYIKEPEAGEIAKTLLESFQQLPLDKQAKYAPLKTAVKVELDAGNYELAKAIIENAQLIDPHDKPIQDGLLSMFEVPQ